MKNTRTKVVSLFGIYTISDDNLTKFNGYND